MKQNKGVRTPTFNIFKIRTTLLETITIGYHYDWLPLRLVTIMIGYHYIMIGVHYDWLECMPCNAESTELLLLVLRDGCCVMTLNMSFTHNCSAPVDFFRVIGSSYLIGKSNWVNSSPEMVTVLL